MVYGGWSFRLISIRDLKTREETKKRIISSPLILTIDSDRDICRERLSAGFITAFIERLINMWQG
jgi:hypothetical protein